MSDLIYSVVVDFTCMEDAVALRDLIEELGVVPVIHQRYAGSARGTPVSTQRLGQILLEEMRKEPTKAYTLEDAEIICEENKYKRNSASPCLGRLVDEGEVKRLGRGLYRVKINV